MMNKKNIALVGFMGAGKSVVSKQLAKALKRRCVSTDELIEKEEKRPIVDIFRDFGEAHFRKAESKVIKQLLLDNALVIDCGGGVVLNQKNIDNLKKNGVVIYLSALPETIYQRVKNQKHRPLLNVDDPKAKIAELLAKRKSCYEQADHTITTDGKSVQGVVKEIISIADDD